MGVLLCVTGGRGWWPAHRGDTKNPRFSGGRPSPCNPCNPCYACIHCDLLDCPGVTGSCGCGGLRTEVTARTKDQLDC
eukprot:1162095-Pelagomonas_calceolata.AAC.1